MKNGPLIEAMRKRAHAVRTRTIIRSWKYRQRDLAAGVWFRVRRTLIDAKEAYVISESDAARLIAEGYVPEPCGARLSPEKKIFFVDSGRLAGIESRSPIPVRLEPDFLLAPAVALVRFDSRVSS